MGEGRGDDDGDGGVVLLSLRLPRCPRVGGGDELWPPSSWLPRCLPPRPRPGGALAALPWIQCLRPWPS
jgi:hypothetical protein